MSIEIEGFLRTRGFHKNPFATTNAEQETEELPAFFQRVAWFDQLVGDPQHPESLILFAPQGHGKTSHRLELGRRAGEHETPALVLTLNDFSPLLRSSLEQVTIDAYIALIRQLFLHALDDQLQRSGRHLRLLQQHSTLWPFFCALLKRYTPRRALAQRMPPELADYAAALEQNDLGAKAWLKELADLAQAAGFASVYVLLDGIDELRETKGQSQAIFRLLSPLLDAPGLLQECGFAFKFFLPQDLEAEMRQQQIGRLDRMPTFSLSWTTDDLCAMLAQRLTAYSLLDQTNPASALVGRFRDLCAVDFDVDARLAQAARTSPRRMIDLAREIVICHCRSTNQLDAPIGRTTVLAVVAPAPYTSHPPQHNDQNEYPEPSQQAPEPMLPNTPSIPLLFVDSRGDVWLGDLRLADELPSLLRKCLDILWHNRARHVSYEELQQALYGASLVRRGDPKSSCEKLVRRLRERLEPGQPSSRRYVDVQAGYGYVLRNVRE